VINGVGDACATAYGHGYGNGFGTHLNESLEQRIYIDTRKVDDYHMKS